jgi:hypothetical protein
MQKQNLQDLMNLFFIIFIIFIISFTGVFYLKWGNNNHTDLEKIKINFSKNQGFCPSEECRKACMKKNLVLHGYKMIGSNKSTKNKYICFCEKK